MRCGIELIRDGQLIEFVAWDNWLFDHFVGEYLLMVRGLPYVPGEKEDPGVCRLRRKVLLDLAKILERQQFDVCSELFEYYRYDVCERNYAAQYGPRLQELAKKYRPGDMLRYCSEE